MTWPARKDAESGIAFRFASQILRHSHPCPYIALAIVYAMVRFAVVPSSPYPIQSKKFLHKPETPSTTVDAFSTHPKNKSSHCTQKSVKPETSSKPLFVFAMFRNRRSPASASITFFWISPKPHFSSASSITSCASSGSSKAV